VGKVDAERYASLIHAYGRATDTPGHLAALRDGDETARDAAMSHLCSAVIHQGTPWTVTPLVAVEVAELIRGPVLSGSGLAGLRSRLLKFLAAVAEACRPDDSAALMAMAYPADREVETGIATMLAADEEWDVDLCNVLYARAVLGCHEVVPVMLVAATSRLTDADPRVRAAAAHASSVCWRVLNRPPEPLGERLAALAVSAGPDERAALALALGELGLAPRDLLADPHPGVRACAALAAALADDDAATAEILTALTDPAACDDWFTEWPPQVRFRIRFSLVAAAVERVDGFERLVPAAVAIARIAWSSSVDFDWGPLLVAAFPGGGPVELPLTESQRRYLAALVDNPDLWDPRNGNAGLVFGRAGLPYDRQACRRLLARIP
jgi:hypothetical protein